MQKSINRNHLLIINSNTMKKNLFFLSLLGILTLTMVSCTDKSGDNELISAEDMTLVEDVLNSIDESVDDQSFQFTEETTLETRNPQCVEISSTAPLGQFPNTITLDYGNGCEGPHGRIRTGKILIHLTDKMVNEGAVRTVSFDNFFVDDIQLTGTKSMTNTGLTANGLAQFLHEVNAITLTFPNGETATRDALHQMTFLKGYDTGTRFDNVVAIMGNATGVGRKGVSYSSEIIEPLIKRGNCRWISEGLQSITRDDQTVQLDYGDGACNGVAIIIFEDGSTREINLYKRWW